MDRERVKKLLDGLVEILATIEHERWSHWQRYMRSKSIRQPMARWWRVRGSDWELVASLQAVMAQS